MRVCLLALLCSFCAQSFAAETLRMGFGSNKPPYVFENQSRGLEYDIVVAALNNVGFKLLPPYYAPMERLHLRLQRGDLDAIATTGPLSGVPAFYSDTYIEYNNVAVALAAKHIQLSSIADLAGHSISSFQRARFLLGPEYQAMAEQNPHYREEAQQIARNRLLYSGRIDLVIGDLRIFKYFNSKVDDQVDVHQPINIYPLFAPTPYSVGFRLERQRDLFNQGLKAIRENGEYQRIEQRYAGQ
jgi:polar amino acid transport system substrate-binding protein